MSGPLPSDAAGPADWRRRLYCAGLAAAFATFLALHALELGLGLTALAGVLLAGITLACFDVSPWPGVSLARPFAIAAAALVAIWPLGLVVWRGASLPLAVHGGAVWPQILVLLFAGRVLAANADQRFVAFWRDPARHRHARTQSLGAAILTGLCLLLVFYAVIPPAEGAAPAALDPGTILRHALGGQTAVHVAIVALFAVTVAAIADAGLVLAADLQGLAALRRGIAGTPRARLADSLATWSHTRPVQELAGRPQALDSLHLASRRLIRALISFLPLLGFLGTVIGLTAAIGGLPENLGPSASANLDIGASLVGLSVKFETTLLGLIGALIASLLLALIERREAEMTAQTRHLIEATANG